MLNHKTSRIWLPELPLGQGTAVTSTHQCGMCPYLRQSFFPNRLPSGRCGRELQLRRLGLLDLSFHLLAGDLLLFWAFAQWLLKAAIQELGQGIVFNGDDSAECPGEWTPSPRSWLLFCKGISTQAQGASTLWHAKHIFFFLWLPILGWGRKKSGKEIVKCIISIWKPDSFSDKQMTDEHHALGQRAPEKQIQHPFTQCTYVSAWWWRWWWRLWWRKWWRWWW